MPRQSSSLPSLPSDAQIAKLRNAQSRAQNLTTFDPTAPNGLVEVEYPLNRTNGDSLPPHSLWGFSLNHNFPAIRCFHLSEARIFTVKGDGPHAGMTYIKCDRKASEACKFSINVNKIHADKNGGLKMKLYSPKFSFPEGSVQTHDPLAMMAQEFVPAPDSRDEAHEVALAIRRSLEDMTANGLSPIPKDSTPAVAGPSRSSAVRKNRPSYIRVISTPPRTDYPLALPPPQDPHHAHALSLHMRQDGSMPIPRPVTPPRGYIGTLYDFATETGVHADVFWTMFTSCRGCNHIMTGDMIDLHVCLLE